MWLSIKGGIINKPELATKNCKVGFDAENVAWKD